jgi:hypothetical protein
MKKAAHVKTDAELSPQRQRRREHEQVYEVNACFMALPVSLGLGSEVSVSGSEGRDWQGSAQLCTGVLQSTGLYGGRAERADGPCALAGEGSTKGFDFETDGCCEGAHGVAVIHAISVFTKEAVLG